jgi:hypothetical protein
MRDSLYQVTPLSYIHSLNKQRKNTEELKKHFPHVDFSKVVSVSIYINNFNNIMYIPYICSICIVFKYIPSSKVVILYTCIFIFIYFHTAD